MRQWTAQTALNQAANSIQPTRTSYINKLAEEMYRQITTEKTYSVKLPKGTTVKPTSYKKAGNMTETQWFHAEDKERDGMLEFQTCIRLPQQNIAPAMRAKALRAHHLYDIKRDMSAKN